MKRILILWLMFGLSGAMLALTPAERKTLTHARTELRVGHEQYQIGAAKLADADKRAAEAEGHAADSDATARRVTDDALQLSHDIDAAHEREKVLGNENAKMKPIYDQVYKYWGIGAILLGFKILATHLLILAAVIIVVMLAAWGLSIAFPSIGAGLKIAGAFLTAMLARVKGMFPKKK